MISIVLAGPGAAAQRTDRYLDALLAAADRRAVDVPAPTDLDPAIRFAARRLVADLARVHPSFRFEERLAVQLGGLATGGGAGGSPETARPLRPIGMLETPAPAAGMPARAALVRPILIGGAVTSAALSIAGAAFVAWRHARPSRSVG
ncbi:MAG: hypothetical protein ACYDCI_13135 [Candidatus Limnocylindrales bacterium]